MGRLTAFALLVFLTCAGCRSSSPTLYERVNDRLDERYRSLLSEADAYGARVRLFVKADPSSVAACPFLGGRTVELIEVNRALEPVGDTLRTWIAHVPPSEDEAYSLLVTPGGDACPERLRAYHVFRGMPAEVWLYHFPAAPFVLISDRELPYLDVR